MGGLRLFDSRLSRSERRVYGAVVVYFLAVTAAMLWPIYPLFGGALPLRFGMPFSLFYQATLLIVSFFVLIALFLWEKRTGRIDRSSIDEQEGGS